MRKLVATFFSSIDGVVDSPQDWHFPYMDEEVMGTIGSSFSGADALLLGRATYQEWEAFWPHQPSDGGVGDFINNTPKYVASSTLESVTWRNTTLLAGDLGAAVRRLKARPGGTIVVNGSGTLVRALLRERLVDELRLLVHPVVVGVGKHLFEQGTEPVGLDLVEMRRFDTGVLSLVYGLAGVTRKAA